MTIKEQPEEEQEFYSIGAAIEQKFKRKIKAQTQKPTIMPQEPINKQSSEQEKSPYDDMIDELVESILAKQNIAKSLDSVFPTK